MNTSRHFGFRPISSFLVLVIAAGNAVAQTSAQKGTINLEGIVISTDLVAPVVSAEDSITESAQAGIDNGVGAETAPGVSEAAATAMEQESAKVGQPESGDIFSGISAANVEPEILVVGTDDDVSDTSTDTGSQGSSSVFSEIKPADTDISGVDIEPGGSATAEQGVATTKPRLPSTTGEQSPDKGADTDVATARPESPSESPVEITGDKASIEKTIEPDIAPVPAESLPARPATTASALQDSQPVSRAPDEQQQESIDEDAIIAGWANAWSKNDVEAYLEYYADDFVPAEPGMDRQGWEKVRRQRLKNEDIRIIVSNAELYETTPQRAEVRFTQRYTSKNYRDRVIKAIEMKPTASGWKFISERTIEELPFE